MAGVQNTREQKFKDWVLAQIIDMEPPQFVKMKDQVVEPVNYPEGAKPLTKAEVDPKNKREMMELITNTYPNLDQSTVIVAKVFKKIGVKAKFEAK